MKILKILGVILTLLVVVYLLGPAPDSFQIEEGPLPEVPSDLQQLEEWISKSEESHPVRPDNQSRIIWADSVPTRTEYAFVYLHGFRASQKEGDPIHKDVASAYHGNLYLHRFAEQGIDTVDAMIRFTAKGFWESAKEALAIGKQLGDKVILISTSTGSSAALPLAAWYPNDVFALISMSPNIEIRDPAAFLLNNPWGLQIARTVLGGETHKIPQDSLFSVYWTNEYRIESLVQLQEFIESTMKKETFERIKCPSLTLYYYKDEENQDPTLKVDAMIRMHNQLGTPNAQKREIAMPKTGAHVIGSYMTSGDVEGVYNEIVSFIDEILIKK